MSKTIFILNELDKQKIEFFKELSKKTDLVVAYYSENKTKSLKFPSIHNKPKKKSFSNLEELEKITQDTKVIIPHTKLPDHISKMIKKNISPQNLIIWSNFTKSSLPKNKVKSYLQKMGYFFRAIKSNLVIAQSKVTKNDLGTVGLPMAGQKLKIINTSVENKKSLATIKKKIVQKKSKQIIFGILDTFTNSDGIDAALTGASFYSKNDSKFIFATTKPEAGRVADKVNVDERITFVKPISNIDKELSKFLKKIDFLICPSLSSEWSRVVQIAHIHGVPVIAPNKIPYIELQKKHFEDLILADISPIHISKAIAKAVELSTIKKQYRKALDEFIKRAHENSIEREVQRWEKIL